MMMIPACKNLNCFLKEEILYLYRQMFPIKLILDRMECNKFIDWLDLEFQDAFVGLVLNDPRCIQYSPSRQYKSSLVKSYVAVIERKDKEVCEGLLQEIMELMNTKSKEFENMDMHYVTYGIPRSSDLFTCRVASVYHEVGLKLWEAAFFLSEYIFHHPQQFEDKNVLELGAGVGLTGMILRQCTFASQVILTDYDPKVLMNLHYNLEINSDLFRQKSIVCQSLDWSVDQNFFFEEQEIDIIVAGDIVYDEACFPYLSRVLGMFLKSKKTNFAIIASTIRNRDTFQKFRKTLSQECIVSQDITKEALDVIGNPLFHYDNRNAITLCKLTANH